MLINSSPLAYLDPMNCNLMHMLVQLFRDALNQYAYAAELAGLKWNLSNTKYGLIVRISCLNTSTPNSSNFPASGRRVQQQAGHLLGQDHGEANELRDRPEAIRHF